MSTSETDILFCFLFSFIISEKDKKDEKLNQQQWYRYRQFIHLAILPHLTDEFAFASNCMNN